MKKIILAIGLILSAWVTPGYAQNLYSFGKDWINLDSLKKADSATVFADTTLLQQNDFKKAGKYAARFNVVNLLGDIPVKAEYKSRPFRIADETHTGYKVTPGSKEILKEMATDEEKLDTVKGSNFLLSTSDGIVQVQRFEHPIGYRITKLDEWAKINYKQTIPHSMETQEKDKDEFVQPYLSYFAHTDRFMAFTSLNTRTIHKTVIMDLKDGKQQPIEATISGVIRAENELSFKGYLFRDEPGKLLKVDLAGNKWMLRDNNIINLVGEAIINDTMLILARYHQNAPGISVVSFSAKTGKLVWSGEVLQTAGIPTQVILSIYKNRLMMEATQNGGSWLEIFDIGTGKRVYSTL